MLGHRRFVLHRVRDRIVAAPIVDQLKAHLVAIGRKGLIMNEIPLTGRVNPPRCYTDPLSLVNNPECAQRWNLKKQNIKSEQLIIPNLSIRQYMNIFT